MAKNQQENTVDNQRPFMGLRSFEESNKAQFGGRDDEIEELYNLIDHSGLTVVFGKSGIGKTSLLKAGLIPELRENFYFPIYLRIDYSSSKSPLQQIKQLIYDKLSAKDKNIPEIGEQTMWEYFHSVTILNGMVTPLFILDQFEETFTIGEERDEDVKEFMTELADLAENRIPLVVQQSYQSRGETVPAHFSNQPYRVVLRFKIISWD